MNHDQVRAAVRSNYAKVAQADSACGCSPKGSSGCCGGADKRSIGVGYNAADLAAVPEGADMGLGCGNPQAIAALKAGETVLDLGSGGGLDVFLAARQIGLAGRVIGVDMTPEMIEKARDNARKANIANVEFRLGEIEHLPVADQSVDVILSNCVINLSPDKPAVFREAFRVLRSGGRLALSDVVAIRPIPAEAAENEALYVGCIAGAALIADLERWLAEAGFTGIRVAVREGSRELIDGLFPGTDIGAFVASALIEAIRP